MSHLVFKLNNVPEEEATEIRFLLEENNIDFYETDSGRWGLGYAAIWMKDKTQLENTKSLIQDYQQKRYHRVISEHHAQEESGEKISRFDFFMTSPVKFTLLLVFAGALAYFTVIPFFK